MLKDPKYGPKILEMVDLIDKISDQYNKHIFSDLTKTTNEGKELLKKYDSITVTDFLKQHIPKEYEMSSKTSLSILNA